MVGDVTTFNQLFEGIFFRGAHHTLTIEIKDIHEGISFGVDTALRAPIIESCLPASMSVISLR
jgi:hypothetical protein